MHRPANSGSCYVKTFQAPLSVYKKYKRGGYPKLDLNAFKDKYIRFGAYGDPAAVPVFIWEALANQASKFTGYTHQWKSCDLRLQKYCMASTDNQVEYFQAKTAGWRSFRVRLETDNLLPHEIICPASPEAGHKLTCSQCTACNGGNKRSNIAIIVHGTTANRYKDKIINIAAA